MQGKFIAIDGIDGAGKNTQILLIAEYLRDKNIRFQTSREPGGSAVGEKIREIFLDKNLEICPESELFLLFAARFQHLKNLILPAINDGQWIISDRYNDATYAYQGTARGIDEKILQSLEALFPNIYREPDLSIILSPDLNTATARRKLRGNNPDRIEDENQDFFDAVIRGYQQRAEKNSWCKIIAADGTPPEVFAKIKPYLDELVNGHI